MRTLSQGFIGVCTVAFHRTSLNVCFAIQIAALKTH